MGYLCSWIMWLLLGTALCCCLCCFAAAFAKRKKEEKPKRLHHEWLARSKTTDVLVDIDADLGRGRGPPRRRSSAGAGGVGPDGLPQRGLVRDVLRKISAESPHGMRRLHDEEESLPLSDEQDDVFKPPHATGGHLAGRIGIRAQVAPIGVCPPAGGAAREASEGTSTLVSSRI